MAPLPLPPPPDFLWAARVARRVRTTLGDLHKRCAMTFAQVFGSRQGGVAPGWRKKKDLDKIDALLKIGLLKRSEDGDLCSDYLITPWEGAFYVTDFPETGNRDEVFAPFPETRFFSTLLQARPGDSVLDLGTGSGILLLEAARHGATGLGIDCSERALAFARANAVLNGLEAQVRFEHRDMTQPPIGDAWGKPTLVLSNPPFEPFPDDPDALPLPLHSGSGPYGDAVVKKMLELLAEWSHRPALVQLVLFSLGRAATRFGKGKHIHLMDTLKNTARATGASLELRELLKPIQLKDFLVLASGSGLAGAQRWLSRMETEDFRTLHLLFANLYFPKLPVPTSESSVRWSPYQYSSQSDESFLWALTSSKRRPPHLGEGDETDLTSRHIVALIEAREELIANKPIELSLRSERVRKFIYKLIRDNTLFNGSEPLLLIDVRSVPAGKSPIGGVVIVTGAEAKFEDYSFDQLQSLTKAQFGMRIGITGCDVHDSSRADIFRVDADEPGYLRWYIDVGNLPNVLEDAVKLPAGVIQRFMVFSAPNACLSPIRQRFFANFLSELVSISDEGNVVSALERANIRIEGLDKAIEIFANITHEARSLFIKQFPDVPSKLETLPLLTAEEQRTEVQRAVHAWGIINAIVELAHLFAKATTLPGSIDELRKRFCDPLASLAARDQLATALMWVASRVYKIEEKSSNVHIEALEAPAVGELNLSPDEFVSCYILTAEPIRNLCQHRANVEATWSVKQGQETGGDLLLRLEYDHSKYKPNSITFQTLGAFLERMNCRATVSWVKSRKKRLRWEVSLGREVLAQQPAKEG